MLKSELEALQNGIRNLETIVFYTIIDFLHTVSRDKLYKLLALQEKLIRLSGVGGSTITSLEEWIDEYNEAMIMIYLIEDEPESFEYNLLFKDPHFKAELKKVRTKTVGPIIDYIQSGYVDDPEVGEMEILEGYFDGLYIPLTDDEKEN